MSYINSTPKELTKCYAKLNEHQHSNKKLSKAVEAKRVLPMYLRLGNKCRPLELEKTISGPEP